MAKKTPTAKKPKQARAAHEIIPTKNFQKALEISDHALFQQKLNEVGKLLWMHEDTSHDAKVERLARALELYESLEPADGAEGMLAVQMVGAHDAALECLRRAAVPNQTFEGRDMALKHAHKLMTLYAQQLATLDKHRGKGQQKVTVEHVNVAAGGQAIVGNVETRKRTSGARQKAPERLEQAEMPTLNAEPAKSKTAKKRS